MGYGMRMAKGNQTVDHILSHAGPIFGEKGPARATGKEICAAANINAAAINYHFGGVDGLYAAVLDRVTAQYLYVDLDQLEAALRNEASPRGKIKIIIHPVVKLLSGPSEMRWMARVAGHELVVPTSLSSPFVDGVERMGRLVREVISTITGMADDDPRLAFTSVAFLGMLQWLVVADRTLIERLFPGFRFESGTDDGLGQLLVDYVLNGLAGLRAIDS